MKNCKNSQHCKVKTDSKSRKYVAVLPNLMELCVQAINRDIFYYNAAHIKDILLHNQCIYEINYICKYNKMVMLYCEVKAGKQLEKHKTNNHELFSGEVQFFIIFPIGNPNLVWILWAEECLLFLSNIMHFACYEFKLKQMSYNKHEYQKISTWILKTLTNIYCTNHMKEYRLRRFGI